MAKGVIIQIIAFSLFFGVALAAYPKKEKKQAFLDSLGTFNDIIMKIINYVMAVAPIGIGVLLASTIGQMGAQVILPLIKYLGVLALGVVVFMILWLIVVTVKTKLNVFQLIKKLTPVSILAIVTTSSAVCLPVAMKDTREKVGVSDYVTNLVLPMGMPLNSNGAAMHMALTVITISQIYGVSYGVGHYFYIALMATLLSLANAVAPGADLVSLAIIVPQLGLPIESIAIFAGVGWFVGALRTILNVDSDIFSAILVADSENEIDRELFKLTAENPDYVRPEAAE
jgi:Na+/H+-dicarboxylate symporter